MFLLALHEEVGEEYYHEDCHEASLGYHIKCGVGKLLEVRVLHLLEEDKAYSTENIYGCHNDGCNGDDGAATMECVGILKRTVEDGHLSDEA